MPEIEMPPQYAGGDYHDPKDLELHVSRAVQLEAADRLQLWATFVLTAIDHFETAAMLHIAELEYEHAADFDFHPVIGGFVSVVIDHFPPTAAVNSVVSPVLDAVQGNYEQNLVEGMASGKLKLQRSVAAFVEAARENTTQVSSDLHAQLPEVVEEAMVWVESASTDPAYVGAMCDYIGMPLPNEENTVNPVRQSLENPFFGIYQSVRAQLLRVQGVPGLDDDDLSPTIWEHEAVERQRELYRRDGPDAWQGAYDELH